MVNKRFVQGRMDRTSGRGFTKRYITVHETDNTAPGATADAHARLQARGNPRKASWGWTVDEKEAVQSYTDDTGCWATGSKNNLLSIDVEVCVNGNRAKAWQNAAELVADLKREHPDARIVQHNFHSGKNCPREMRASGRWESWLASIGRPKPEPEPNPEPTKDEFDMASINDLNNAIKSGISGLETRLTLLSGLQFGFYNIEGRGDLVYALEADGSFTPISNATWGMFRRSPQGAPVQVQSVSAEVAKGRINGTAR